MLPQFSWKSFSPKDALYVFALESEAAGEFAQHNLLFTGIGKVNATYALTKYLAYHKPSVIINLGSAGSRAHRKGTLVSCTRFVQRDMDVRGLGFQQYETPLSQVPVVLEYGMRFDGIVEATCGSGDSFEMNHRADAYDVVDMEAYALALIAHKEQCPFLCLKYISDGADGLAADDWSEHVHRAARAFASVLL